MKKLGNRFRRGSVLVFVLAMIVLLSVLCLRLMEETVQELRHVSQFYRRDDLRMHAYSALDVAAGVLAEFKTFDGGALKPGGGWEDPLAWTELSPLEENVRWSISIFDESGKLPLFSTHPKVMKEIFAIMHKGDDGLVDEDDGEPYYDALMDWQDSDDEERDEGAEDDYYEDLNPPYFTPGRNIQSFEELRMVRGFGHDEDDPEEGGLFFDRLGHETQHMRNFRATFSLYNEKSVNFWSASGFLKKYLAGDDDDLHESLISGNAYSQDVLRPTNPLVPTTPTSTVFRVEISVDKGKANFQLHAVLGPHDSLPGKVKKPGKTKPGSPLNRKLQYPFRILSLRENENLID